MAHPTHLVPPSAARAPPRALRTSSAPRPHRDRRERAQHIAARPTPRRDPRSPSKISVRWRLQFAVFVRRLRSIARSLRCSIPGASTLFPESNRGVLIRDEVSCRQVAVTCFRAASRAFARSRPPRWPVAPCRAAGLLGRSRSGRGACSRASWLRPRDRPSAGSKGLARRNTAAPQ